VKARGILAALMLLPIAAAHAGLSQADLGVVAAAPPPDARLDLALSAPDIAGNRRRLGDVLAGKPAFLVFADYTCTTLCGPILSLLANAIERAQLSAAAFRILVVSIDPKDSAQSAETMARGEIPSSLRPATTFLLPDEATVTAATAALGYRFAYDASADQFAHPAAVYVIAADGRVQGVLSPFSLTTGDLGETLTRAATSQAGLLQQIRLLCYAYDPVTGIYSARIDILLKLGAGATVIVLGAAILVLGRRERWKA
jgi:protein SCO1